MERTALTAQPSRERLHRAVVARMGRRAGTASMACGSSMESLSRVATAATAALVVLDLQAALANRILRRVPRGRVHRTRSLVRNNSRSEKIWSRTAASADEEGLRAAWER